MFFPLLFSGKGDGCWRPQSDFLLSLRPPRQETFFLTDSTIKVLVKNLIVWSVLHAQSLLWAGGWVEILSDQTGFQAHAYVIGDEEGVSCDWQTLPPPPGPLKRGKDFLQRKRLARPINKVIYYAELLSFPSLCPVLLFFFSRGLLSLSVSLTHNTFSSTVVFYLEFTNY